MRLEPKVKQDKRKWHEWYAWRPVKLECGDWVWRETVLRKRVTVIMVESGMGAYEDTHYIYEDADPAGWP